MFRFKKKIKASPGKNTCLVKSSPQKKKSGKGVLKPDETPLEDCSPIFRSQKREIRNPELRKYYQMDCTEMEEKKVKKLSLEQPPGTMEYIVELEDTLFSIASKFNSTPNQLVHLNRLNSQTLIPGQHLFIPHPDGLPSETCSAPSSPLSSPLSPSEEAEYDKLLDVETVTMPDGQLCFLTLPSECCSSLLEDPSAVRYLKFCCKYITDRKGVVSGVMLVTPNSVTFDPYKSHPLVIEHGCEEYYFSSCIDSISSAIFHRDPSRVKFSTFSPLPNKKSLPKDGATAGGGGVSKAVNDTCERNGQKVSVQADVHRTSEPDASNVEKEEDVSLHTDSTKPEVEAATVDETPPLCERQLCSELQQKLNVTTIADFGQNISDSQGHVRTDKNAPITSQNKTYSFSSSRGQLNDSRAESVPCASVKKTEMADDSNIRSNAVLPHPKADSATIPTLIIDSHEAVDSNKNRIDSNKGVFDDNHDAREMPHGSYINSRTEQQQKTELRRHEDPEVKHTSKEGSQKNTSNKHALLFLCLKVKVPQKKRPIFPPTSKDATKHKIVNYWFILAQNKSDEMYAYLSHWRPDVNIFQGEDDLHEEDFVLLDGKEDLYSFEKLTEDWEIIEEAAKSKVFLDSKHDKELENIFPVLLGKTNLLKDGHIAEISDHLPPRTVGYPWYLAYSTLVHGFSLKTLYRNLQQTSSPVLLVIRDTQNQIFGALTSHPLKPSDSFYGTGESFLFTFNPDFKFFPWSGDNSFFIKGDKDSIAIGGGSGYFGLWLDENLYHGRSNPCSTFNNCILSKTDDFHVQDLEAWIFYN
ncbi:nuclear receptor coactivator 7-like isoform X2 [Protopterus annectens]|uniref:nuclear receptor coactivator 7-like isoform X2 n=1 Tax=Protopterus annectens TaxID=7888 RepID=UPI001CFA755F|nr:nuclear receptor coactivator 7-like isoform X2 [Protopterus annectens]